jgi:hypothetical protein
VYDIVAISRYLHSKWDIFFYCFSREKLKILEYNSYGSSIGEEFLSGERIDIHSDTIMYDSLFWI